MNNRDVKENSLPFQNVCIVSHSRYFDLNTTITEIENGIYNGYVGLRTYDIGSDGYWFLSLKDMNVSGSIGCVDDNLCDRT